ncbi:MAG: hypothetical protein HY302_15570 [Opitutae bacterium]|nr:hypothetical protein [Opitutae bacterium]
MPDTYAGLPPPIKAKVGARPQISGNAPRNWSFAALAPTAANGMVAAT